MHMHGMTSARNHCPNINTTDSTLLVNQELEEEEQRKQDAIAAEEAARIKVCSVVYSHSSSDSLPYRLPHPTLLCMHVLNPCAVTTHLPPITHCSTFHMSRFALLVLNFDIY